MQVNSFLIWFVWIMTTTKSLGYSNFIRAMENLNSPKGYSPKIINAQTRQGFTSYVGRGVKRLFIDYKMFWVVLRNSNLNHFFHCFVRKRSCFSIFIYVFIFLAVLAYLEHIKICIIKIQHTSFLKKYTSTIVMLL